MRILISDETNNEPQENVKFFLYGGVIFNSDSIKGAGDEIRKLRDKFGLSSTDKIKFNIKSRPNSLSPEQHKELKSKIIDIAIDYDVQVIINFVLHAIAKNKSKDDLLEMTSATVFRRFDDFCETENTAGLVLGHRWPTKNGYPFFESVHHAGIEYASGNKIKFESIYGFAQISNNSTSLMSIADIILGAFRYCINERDKTIVNTELMPKIAKLMWCKVEGDQSYPRGRGLNISPHNIRRADYKEEYDSLLEHIVKFANSK